MKRVVLGVTALGFLVAGAITPTPFNGVDLTGFALTAALIWAAVWGAATTDPGGTMPQLEHVARPVVLIANQAGGRYVARCGHCDWTYANTVKVDVEQQAKYHRGLHRTGIAQPVVTA